MTLSDEETKQILGIDKLSEAEAKDLLLLAIQELESIMDCEKCEEADTCDLNFQEPFPLHCQKMIIAQLLPNRTK